MKKSYFDLIELIEQQNQVIMNQSKTIVGLLNENAEQENMINVLMQDDS